MIAVCELTTRFPRALSSSSQQSRNQPHHTSAPHLTASNQPNQPQPQNVRTGTIARGNPPPTRDPTPPLRRGHDPYPPDDPLQAHIAIPHLTHAGDAGGTCAFGQLRLRSSFFFFDAAAAAVVDAAVYEGGYPRDCYAVGEDSGEEDAETRLCRMLCEFSRGGRGRECRGGDGGRQEGC